MADVSDTTNPAKPSPSPANMVGALLFLPNDVFFFALLYVDSRRYISKL